MQRCKLVMDQVTEARDTMMKVLDHKEKVLKLLNKNGTVKKSSKLKRKERAWAPPLWRGIGADHTLVLLMIACIQSMRSPPQEWTQKWQRASGDQKVHLEQVLIQDQHTNWAGWSTPPLPFILFLFWTVLLTELLPLLLIQHVTWHIVYLWYLASGSKNMSEGNLPVFCCMKPFSFHELGV